MLAGYEAIVQRWVAGLAGLPGVLRRARLPERSGAAARPRDRAPRPESALDARGLVAALWDATRASPSATAGADAIALNPQTLEAGRRRDRAPGVAHPAESRLVKSQADRSLGRGRLRPARMRAMCCSHSSGSGEPAAPRRQSLLRSQARCALLPAAHSPNVLRACAPCVARTHPGRGSLRPPAASRCCARKLAARSFPRRPPAAWSWRKSSTARTPRVSGAARAARKRVPREVSRPDAASPRRAVSRRRSTVRTSGAARQRLGAQRSCRLRGAVGSPTRREPAVPRGTNIQRVQRR